MSGMVKTLIPFSPFLGLLALQFSVDAWSVNAQVRTIRGPAGGESQYEIVVEHVVTLGEREGPGYVDNLADFARTSAGNWILTHVSELSKIMVFDSAGTYLRSVGRKGQGPREFSFIAHLLVDSAGFVNVFDLGNARMAVYSPGLEFLRTIPLEFPGPTDIVPIADSAWVFAGDIRSLERGGLPLHLVDAKGRLGRSFGAVDPVFRRDIPQLTVRNLALSPEGEIWSAHLLEYRIERWTIEGTQEDELVREVDWFQPNTNPGFVDAESPPNPSLAEIEVDENGFLWVLIGVADEDWRDGLGLRPGVYGRERILPTSDEKYYDTIIEVIDPETGFLLATERVPERLRRLKPGGYAASYREDEEGYPFIDIWRVRIERTTGR